MFISICSQVFLTAIFFSLIWKNPGEAEDDQPEDEEEPRLEHDEELLHKPNQGNYACNVLDIMSISTIKSYQGFTGAYKDGTLIKHTFTKNHMMFS